MTIELSPDLERLVQDKAAENGVDVSAYVANVLHEALDRNGVAEAVRQRKPISAQFEEIRRQAPAEVRKALDELPSDFAAEHDHYLYGVPKKYA